jgi:hypothetical protein
MHGNGKVSIRMGIDACKALKLAYPMTSAGGRIQSAAETGRQHP